MRVSLLALLLAATAGITTKQAVTSAPGHAVNLAASSGTEGTSLAFMRADATLGVSGLLPDANLAGAYSGIGSCAASSWVQVLTRNAPPGCFQPAFSDISGAASTAQIPNLDASKTTTGIFATARIPSLDASAIGTGTLSQARGGTGAGALNCGAAGNFLTSNGTAQSCAAQTVTGPLMIAQFTLSGATTSVTGMPALNMVCICNDVSVGNTLCKATTSLAVMTITGTNGHLANVQCGPAQGTGSLSGGGF